MRSARPSPGPSAALDRRRWLAGAAACGALAACRDHEVSAGPDAITFALPVSGRAPRRQSDWRPFLADMAAATGLTVTPVFVPNDGVLLEAMQRRRIDAGWFSNEAALAAVRSGGAEVFAHALGPDGAAGYQSVLVTGAQSRIDLERVLKCDRTLTYGQAGPGSTPERLAPVGFLFGPAKIDPAKCFKAVRVSDPEANLAAVAAGALDVAASDTALVGRLTRENPAEAAKVQTIWSSPPLPEDPMLWRRDLDPVAKEKLRQFFITDARGDTPAARRQQANLALLDVGSFEAADDNHLLMAREIEARVRWAQAVWGGDAARIEAARRSLEAAIAERQAFEGRVNAPAGTQ